MGTITALWGCDMELTETALWSAVAIEHQHCTVGCDVELLETGLVTVVAVVTGHHHHCTVECGVDLVK